MVFIETIVTPTRNLATGVNIATFWSTLVFISMLAISGSLIVSFKKEKIGTFAKASVAAIIVHTSILIASFIGQNRGLSAQYIGYRITAWSILILAVLLAIAVVIIEKTKGEKLRRNETLSIAFAGVTVAMSFALSYVRFFRMPYAGSITLARFVPLAIYSYIFGVKRGLAAGLVWGTLRLFVDPFIVHPVQFILEYPISFMTVGLAGFSRYLKVPRFLPSRFKRRISWNNRLHPSIALVIGLLLVVTVRYAIHVTSGVIWISAFTQGGPNAHIANESTNAILGFSLMMNSVQILDALIGMIAVAVIMLSPQMLNLVKRTEQKFLINNTTIKPKELPQSTKDEAPALFENIESIATK